MSTLLKRGGKFAAYALTLAALWFGLPHFADGQAVFPYTQNPTTGAVTFIFPVTIPGLTITGSITIAGNGAITGNLTVGGALGVTGNTTLAGKATIAGSTIIGGGNPWADVTSGANGCAAATGNGTSYDYPAVNCQAAFMAATFGGGFVWLPAGSYNFVSAGVGHTLTLNGSVILQGAGRGITAILNTTADNTVIAFPCGGGLSGCATPSASYGGIRDLTIDCYFNSAATNDCVTIGNNNPVFIRDTNILGGRAGLNTAGSDGTVANSYITGYTYGLLSSGSNWYIRDKFDGPEGSGVAATYAIFQGAPGYPEMTIAENHFVQTDTSGSWSLSIELDSSSATNAVLEFDGGVIADGVNVVEGVAQFLGNELGGSFTIGASGSSVVVGNYAGSLTITNGGTLKCAANIGITNSGC